MASEKRTDSKTVALYCGLSAGIGLTLGYVAARFLVPRRSSFVGPDFVRKLSFKNEQVYEYLFKKANRFIPELQEIHEKTYAKFPGRAIMMTSKDQCYFLKWLTSLIDCRKAIEVGVFTGSSALCIAQGLNKDGKLVAIDVDVKYTNLAKEMWKKAGVSDKIELNLKGGTVALNELLADKSQPGTFDFAYVDAVKTEYGDYYEKLLLLVRKGGIIAFDNTLQRGRVALSDEQLAQDDTLDARRVEGATFIREFNEKMTKDDRVDMCLLSIGDGLTLLQVK